MRPAYWELAKRGGPKRLDAVVLGRKFCVGCGHWRHVCDFDTHRDRLRARCQACTRAYNRAWLANATPEQRERIREYYRFWSDAKRRRQGARQRKHPRSVVDRVEYVYLPAAPLSPLIERYAIDHETSGRPDGDTDGLKGLARRAGLGERTVRRFIDGSSRHIRIDLADRLAFALGVSMFEVWGDTPAVKFDFPWRPTAAQDQPQLERCA